MIEDWLAGDNGVIQSLGNHLYTLASGKCGGPLTAFKAKVAVQLEQGDLTAEQAETLLELADVICEVLAGPFTVRVVALNVVAIERCLDGGTMDPVPVGEFIDPGAGKVGGDQFADLGGGQASLDGV